MCAVDNRYMESGKADYLYKNKGGLGDSGKGVKPV